jgi:hypothetical protein
MGQFDNLLQEETKKWRTLALMPSESYSQTSTKVGSQFEQKGSKIPFSTKRHQ